MKKIILSGSILLLAVAGLFWQGCLKDSAKRTYTYYTPVIHTTAEVRAGIKSGVAQPVVNPGKMYVTGNTIFLAEKEKGIHIIDNSNPSNPVNKWFIDIPGNEDIAVSGNILYADCYTDLMAIDISNPNSISLKNYATYVFPERQYVNGYYADSGKMITDWIRHDTTDDVDFSDNSGYPVYDVMPGFSSSAASSSSLAGVAGSMSKLAVVQNRLYAVSREALYAFNITNLADPLYLLQKSIHLGIGSAETIYPFQDKLFIGTTTGMNIFSIANPDEPTLLGTFSHATACDPVIADNTTAFVTLRSGPFCNSTKDELDVVDVTNVMNPSLIKSYNMTNPKGLSKDGNILFVCDGDALKIYDASGTSDLKLKNTVSIKTPYDIICLNKTAIVTAADGLYQYNYSDLNNIKLLSKLSLNVNF
jgi:hypothetical protein